MKMRRVDGYGCKGGVAFLFALALFSGARSNGQKATVTLETLRQQTQQLWDAVASGDKRPWQQMIADDAMIFDEKGRDMDKAGLLATIEKLPDGYSGTIAMADVEARFAAETAILSYNANETETVFGTVLHARYHMTDTWLYRRGEWQIVASQVLRYYEDPAATPLAPDQLEAYVGRYELAPGQMVSITREGDQLYGQRGPGKPYPLMAECADLFFRPAVEGRKLFRRDAKGRVDAMIDRRNNEDLVWKRVE